MPESPRPTERPRARASRSVTLSPGERRTLRRYVALAGGGTLASAADRLGVGLSTFKRAASGAGVDRTTAERSRAGIGSDKPT